MFKQTIYILLLLALPLSAKVLISPIDAMKSTYGSGTIITKKNILLSSSRAKTIEQAAQVKLSSKIFRIFKATKDTTLLGYGVLINKKVRSKNAVVLYFISKNSILKSIEIIAFNEPLEYLPSKNWNSQFKDISTDTMLKSSRDIPTITGATLSARAITNGSRVAFAIYNEMLKEK
ncbi:MAG: electron transport complex protein RnfG [Sulfurimonas sp.]|jgi:electron transport complex protein RnfG|uniref:FMN-binding protein n=1 Tax=Sulfurimonas sp. TaxID=2022749 RepID=UPI0039E3BF83